MIDREEYQQYVKDNAPKSPMVRTLLAAFLVGGIICCIGEGIGDILRLIFKDMSDKNVAIYESCIMIFWAVCSLRSACMTSWDILPAVVR